MVFRESQSTIDAIRLSPHGVVRKKESIVLAMVNSFNISWSKVMAAPKYIWLHNMAPYLVHMVQDFQNR